MKHVSRVHSHSSGFSITCGIQGCLRTYTNYTSWVKHVHSKHSEVHSELHSEDDDDFVAMEIDEFNEIESNTTEIQLQNHKDKEKARWILNLRDENKLTQTCTDNILSNVTLLCSQLVDDIKQAVAKQLQESEASSDITEKVLQLLDNPDYGTVRFKLDTRECSTRVFFLLVPSFFVKSRVFITTAREIAVHNTLRATCKSHDTSMQNTCVISKTMARRKSNLKMGRIFMQTHLPLCSDGFYQFSCLPSLRVPANKHVLSTLNY